MRSTLFAVLLLSAATAHAAPIRHVIHSASTSAPDTAHWYAQALPGLQVQTFLESEVDATLDHQTGFVTINRWDVFGTDGGVVYSVPPHSAQLALESPGNFAGDGPLGHIAFWPYGVIAQGTLLAFYPAPQPSIDVALVPGFPNLKPWMMRSVTIQTPEPAAVVMLMLASVISARRPRAPNDQWGTANRPT